MRLQRDFSGLDITGYFKPESGSWKFLVVISSYASTVLLGKNFGIGLSDTGFGTTVVTLIYTGILAVYVYFFYSDSLIGNRDSYALLIIR